MQVVSQSVSQSEGAGAGPSIEQSAGRGGWASTGAEAEQGAGQAGQAGWLGQRQPCPVSPECLQVSPQSSSSGASLPVSLL